MEMVAVNVSSKIFVFIFVLPYGMTTIMSARTRTKRKPELHRAFSPRVRGCSNISGVKRFIVLLCVLITGVPGLLGAAVTTASSAKPAGLRLATFDIDATPPVGSFMAYDPVTNKWDLGLRARGIVLLGAGEPIVLCALDWIGIANESHDAFRAALARAAGTVPGRVSPCHCFRASQRSAGSARSD